MHANGRLNHQPVPSTTGSVFNSSCFSFSLPGFTSYNIQSDDETRQTPLNHWLIKEQKRRCCTSSEFSSHPQSFTLHHHHLAFRGRDLFESQRAVEGEEHSRCVIASNELAQPLA